MFPSKQGRISSSTLLISKYLSSELITFLKVDGREEALLELSTLLYERGKLKEKEPFYQAILERERIISTGIGMGVAIPHAKLPIYNNFFIALGIHRKGIPWDAIDGLPVRLIFMIGGPDHKQTEYLQILSRLTLALKDEERRKKMLQLDSPEAILALFKGL